MNDTARPGDVLSPAGDVVSSGPDGPPPAPPHIPRWVVLGFIAASVLVLWPYWVWVVLAVWVGQAGRNLQRPLARMTGGRNRAAAILTAALLAILVVPLGLALVTLLFDAIDLAKRLMASPQISSALEQLVTPSSQQSAAQDQQQQQQPLQLLVEHGGKAWQIIGAILAVAAEVVLGLFIFVSGVYTVLSEGPAAYRWLEQHLPIDAMVTRRFAAAFAETGHGLFIGVGGSGLAQAVVATTAYLIIGVPEAFVLGLLTLMASVIPSVGTALIWVPVTIGLALTGRTEAAIAMAAVGVTVIGAIDNLVRPILARRGQLALPSYMIMVSMFGGLVLVGASGVVFGPLILRMTKEALLIAREERIGTPPPP